MPKFSKASAKLGEAASASLVKLRGLLMPARFLIQQAGIIEQLRRALPLLDEFRVEGQGFLGVAPRSSERAAMAPCDWG